MPPLPIETVIPEVRARLSRGRALVLQAPPGAGKTTRIPLALLAEPWLTGRSILMLEPRRLAAKAAAGHMARLLDEPVGHSVGYRTRFDSRVSSRTRIEVLTEGILTRRLQNDPELTGIALVIFDEVHERHWQTDLALALCLESRQSLRPDLRLLLMSATLDGETLARLLDNAPVITSRGRSHPVAVHYLAQDPPGPVAAAVAEAVVRAVRADRGDILAFLPGEREIRRTRERLAAEPLCAEIQIHPLYADLPYAEQQQALAPAAQGRRKIVLATPVAETSLTIEGIQVVVDGGWMRVPRFDPRSGLTRLDTVRVSADSAEQRAGRAGRLGPGVCYRLWSEATQRRLPPRRAPEILEADLASLALELACWGVEDSARLTWPDPPPAGALAQARSVLTALEALDARGRITATGRDLAALPLHPRLAHLLMRGRALGLGELAADLAALLGERDILRDRGGALGARVEALRAFRRQGAEGARRLGADPMACAQVERAARQWHRKPERSAGTPLTGPEEQAVGMLLAQAYPDRIARRREGSPERYVLANGRGVRLRADDPLLGRDWLVAAHLDAGTEEGLIHLAAPVAPADLEAHLAAHIQEHSRLAWDARQAAVVARRERRLGGLILASRPLENADPAGLRRAMLEGVRQLGLDSLPWTEELRQWQARVLTLRGRFPEEGWPDLSDERLTATLDDWLAPHLDGITRRDHLERLELGRILNERLDWPLRARLEQAAPTHIRVPSGARRRLHYTPGQAPVLAVKLQELFGLADTPRIADGRLPITLHLLSPAQRPIQVTQDLRGFWERTYAQVKKELKGRYPKHPWPDDPWAAAPTGRAQPRVRKDKPWKRDPG